MAKVLILTDVFGTGGGAGAVALTMAEALAGRHAVRVLTADAPADLTPATYRLRVHAVAIPARARNFLGVRHPRALGVLDAELVAHRPDAAFVHNIHSAWSYASLAVLARHGVRTVLTYHDVVAFTPYAKLCGIAMRRTAGGSTFDYRYPWWRHLRQAKLTYNPWRNAAIRRALALAPAKVAVSAALASALRANGVGVDAVIYNGRDPVALDGVPAERSAIFFGGRLSSAKGMLQVVEYLVALRQRHRVSPTVLVVGNPGVAAKKLQAAASAAGVAGQLTFCGWQPQAEYLRLLASCRLALVPSICFDSLPTVVLDAMAVGRPAIASIFGGSSELIVDGQTGYVVDPFDAPAVAGRLAELLTDAPRADALGAAGRARLVREFSIAGMIQQYEQLAGM